MAKARITLTLKVDEAEALLDAIEEHVTHRKSDSHWFRSQSISEEVEALESIAYEIRYTAGVKHGY